MTVKLLKKHNLFFCDIWHTFGWRFAVLIFIIAITGLMEGVALTLLLPLLNLLGIGDAPGSRLTMWLTSAFRTVRVPYNAYSVTFLCCVIFTMQYAMFIVQSLLAAKLRSKYIAVIRNRLFSSVINAKWDFFVKNKVAALSNAVINEADRAGVALDLLVNLCSIVIVTGIYITIAFTVSWKITISLLIAGVLMSVVLFGFMKKGNSIGEEISVQNENLYGWVNGSFGGAKVVKSTAAEAYVIKYFGKIADRIAKLYALLIFQPSLIRAIIEFTAISGVIVALLICTQIFSVNLAVLLVVLALFTRIYPKLSTFQHSLQSISIYLPAVEYINEIQFNADLVKERLPSVASVLAAPTTLALSKAVDIKLQNISVKYEHKEVLQQVSLHIPPGEITAIIGSSGAGKTTILDCIVGMVVPNRGEILINDQPLSELSLTAWRNAIGYVAQETILFNTTIRDNIIWNNTDVTEYMLLTASKIAGADKFINELPLGYDTVVGDRAMRISGGQKQRLGIARAVLGNKKLLILDEATSSLDAQTEEEIMNAILALRNKMTIVMVTHRLAKIKYADCVYVVADGKVEKMKNNIDLPDELQHISSMQ